MINKRTELNNLKANLKERQEKLEAGLKNYFNLKQKLAQLGDDTLTMEQKMEQLEQFLEKEGLKDKELTREVKTMKESRNLKLIQNFDRVKHYLNCGNLKRI